jgi:hypothetical protein
MSFLLPLRHVSLAAILVLTVSAPVFSQLRVREHRVQFERGQSSALLKGATPKPAEGDFDQYLLRARQSQMLRVDLETADAQAYLIIYAVGMSPPEDCLSCGRGGFSRHTKPPPEVRSWSGRLPVSGEYSIQVYTGSQGGVPYTLSLSVR